MQNVRRYHAPPKDGRATWLPHADDYRRIASSSWPHIFFSLIYHMSSRRTLKRASRREPRSAASFSFASQLKASATTTEQRTTRAPAPRSFRRYERQHSRRRHYAPARALSMPCRMVGHTDLISACSTARHADDGHRQPFPILAHTRDLLFTLYDDTSISPGSSIHIAD